MLRGMTIPINIRATFACINTARRSCILIDILAIVWTIIFIERCTRRYRSLIYWWVDFAL